MSGNNSTLQVNGVWLPTPSVMAWGLQDVSAEGAGRTQDARMHKVRIAQKRKLSLEWWGENIVNASLILSAVNPEYIDVTYPDPMDGTRVTRNFYVGDRTSPVRIIRRNGQILYDISFDIIER